VICFSSVPFLTLLAVLLLRREDVVSQVFGAVAGVGAVVALVAPFIHRYRGRPE
jgi:ABC-type methionine transport system permease subunit